MNGLKRLGYGRGRFCKDCVTRYNSNAGQTFAPIVEPDVPITHSTRLTLAQGGANQQPLFTSPFVPLRPSRPSCVIFCFVVP